MLRIRNLVLLLFAFCCCAAKAQNLVPNPSFETFSSCPNGVTIDINLAPPWYAPTAGTSDYWHACAGRVPTNTFGTQAAHTGQGYIGLHLHQELAQVQLTQKLEAGKNYCVSFYMSRADEGKFATTDIGINLSETAIVGAPLVPKPVLPYHISTPPGDTMIDIFNWTLVSGMYTATGGEEFLTLGSFLDPTPKIDMGGFYFGPYYYFDDISVVEFQAPDLGADRSVCGVRTIPLDPGVTVPATYLWNNGATDPSIAVTLGGTYWVDVTIGECTVRDSVTISFGGGVNGLDLGEDTTICGGSSLNLDATTANATYLWQDGSTTASLTASQTGTYWVQVEANGCMGNDTIELVISDSIMLTTSQTVSDSCDRLGSLTASVSVAVTGGNPPYNYQWDDAQQQTTATANAVGPGTYTVSVSGANGECPVSASETVERPLQIDITPTHPSCASCTDGSVSATVTGTGTPPYGYRWNDPNEQTTATATGLGSGTYVVTVTDSKGCFDTVSVTIGSVGFNELPLTDFRLYPNPGNGEFTVNFAPPSHGAYTFTVYNVIGKAVYSSVQVYSGNVTKAIELAHAQTGIYILEITHKDLRFTRKIQVFP